MSTYADSWIHTRMLEIARAHRDALDTERVIDGCVIGQDNFDKLYVSTVFSALAIERAVNDFIQTHALFSDLPYFQKFFGLAVEQLLWLRNDRKLKLVTDFYSGEVDGTLLEEVKRLIKIRNSIVHPKGEFKSSRESDDGRSCLSTSGLSEENVKHMLGHVEIAERFLGSFGPPGTNELDQWRDRSKEETRTIVFRFRDGPSDGNSQRCDPSARQSWWAHTGGEVGREFSFVPEEGQDALKSGRRIDLLQATYRILKRTETADEIEVVCQYVPSD